MSSTIGVMKHSPFSELESREGLVRRFSLETRLDMLKAVMEGPIVSTRLMYRANLTWSKFLNHLDFLVGRGLLFPVELEGRKRYQLTPRGFGVLESYRRLTDEMNGPGVLVR